MKREVSITEYVQVWIECQMIASKNQFKAVILARLNKIISLNYCKTNNKLKFQKKTKECLH